MERLKALYPIFQLIKNHKLTALIIFIIFWLGLLAYAGTLNSGFHFIDDHEIIRIQHDLSQNNVFSVLSEWITRDFSLRFRPFYFFHRVLSVFVLGDNFLLLSIQNLVLAIGTSFALFLSFRNLKFSAIQSYLFVFLALIGSQAAIWWRLGPNETIAIFTFSVGLYFITKSYCVDKRIRLFKYLGFAFVVLASLSKESFIALIPAVLLINYILFAKRYKVSLKQNLLQNRAVNIFFPILLAIEGYMIFFVVGINRIGYAGGDQSSLNPIKWLVVLKHLLIESNLNLVIFVTLIFFAACGFYFYKNNKLPTKILKYVFIALALTVVILLPQMILHAKSDIYERYLIPGTLGVAFIIVVLISQALEIIEDKKLKLGLFVLIMAYTAYPMLIPKLKATVDAAQAFAYEGYTVNQALEYTVKTSDENSPIIIVADPVVNFEQSYSMKFYLDYVGDRSNLYYDVIGNDQEVDTFNKGLRDGFVNFLNAKVVEDLADKNVKTVFVFGNVEQVFLKNAAEWFRAENYSREVFGGYVVYSEL